MKSLDLKNAALVTHKNCMDGSGCAIVFCKAGGSLSNVRFANPNHKETDEVVLDLMDNWPGPIIIADVSISQELANKVRRDNVYLLDHHKSAVPLNLFSWCEIEVENNRCGSKMLYDWLLVHGDGKTLSKYKQLIDLIDDNDLWRRNYPESDTISLFHQVLGQELFIDRFLRKHDTTLDQTEQYVIELEKKKRDKFIESKKREVVVVAKQIDDKTVKLGFVQANSHQSLLGNSICSDPMLDVDIAVLVGTSLSLRARNDCPVDLSKLSKNLGGGGHARASGCSLNKMLNSSLVDFVKNYILNHSEVWEDVQ